MRYWCFSWLVSVTVCISGKKDENKLRNDKKDVNNKQISNIKKRRGKKETSISLLQDSITPTQTPSNSPSNHQLIHQHHLSHHFYQIKIKKEN